jgi:hypothetical protein
MENTIPSSSTNSRFGASKPARVEEFKKLLTTQPTATDRIVFQEKTVDIPIIRIPIDLPKYRMMNGRTVSLQEEHLAKHPSIRQDIFSGDAELWDAQEAQHNLLLQLSKQSDLQKFFEDTANKQVNPIRLDENGFVVDGNRRLEPVINFKKRCTPVRFQAISLGWNPRPRSQEPPTPVTSAMRNGTFAVLIWC